MVVGSRALGQQDYEQVNRAFLVNLAGDLAMLLVNRLSDGIDYNYRNGVNCTVLKFYR